MRWEFVEAGNAVAGAARVTAQLKAAADNAGGGVVPTPDDSVEPAVLANATAALAPDAAESRATHARAMRLVRVRRWVAARTERQRGGGRSLQRRALRPRASRRRGVPRRRQQWRAWR